MTPRILHIFDHSLPLHSGYTFRSANILRGQQALGWQTYHLTSPKQIGCHVSEEEADGLHFYRTPQPEGVIRRIPILNQWAIMQATQTRLAQLARHLKPDILHAHSPILNAFPAITVGRKLGIPVVYEIRAFWEDAAVDHGTQREGGARYRLTRALETHACRQADCVVTICDGLRTDLIGRGIPPEKIYVVPNAVDIEQFHIRSDPDSDLQAELGLSGCKVIGFLGSYYAYEGLDLLIAAMPSILGRMPEARLLMVGGGPQEAKLKSLAKSLGVSDKVIFVGRIPHAEVNRYYSLVDLLAYPRHPMRLTELVTPLKPLEAMAQGQLLIASDVGGHRELIRDGDTGVLFKAGDKEDLAEKVLSTLRLPDNGQTLRVNGRTFVEHERTWSISVANYKLIYGAVLPRCL